MIYNFILDNFTDLEKNIIGLDKLADKKFLLYLRNFQYNLKIDVDRFIETNMNLVENLNPDTFIFAMSGASDKKYLFIAGVLGLDSTKVSNMLYDKKTMELINLIKANRGTILWK